MQRNFICKKKQRKI